MFTLNVAFGSIAWVLAFRNEDDAKAAVSKLLALPHSAVTLAGIQIDNSVTITDDFGQSISCKNAPTAILFEELEKSKILQIEYRMHQARIQADFQKRAEADQALRMRQGPAVLNPMGGMVRPNGGF